jgi:predicted SAM-dependent methyltransferase
MRRWLKRFPWLYRPVKAVYVFFKRFHGQRRLRAAARQGAIRLVIGASGFTQPGWTATDIEYLNLLNPSDWEAVFRPGSIDIILAEHVWEHLTPEEGLDAARQCHAYLRPGGYLRVAVPDGCFPDEEYRRHVRPGGTGAGADTHRVLYTHRTFSEVFRKAGFRVELLEYYDSNGKFHFVEWDPQGGLIHRSRRFDKRNKQGPLKYTSIILDAHKDSASLPG